MRVYYSFKKGDRILYKTPRGNVKTFIYGKQTWYRNSLPNRAFKYYRGKVLFRPPNISELFAHTYHTRRISKLLSENVYGENPFLKLMPKRMDFAGATIAVPISYKNNSK